MRFFILWIFLSFVQSCGFLGQNATNNTSGDGPLSSFRIQKESSKKVILNAEASKSFLGETNGKPSGYLEYRWTFENLDGSYFSQQIGFAKAGNLDGGNQTLILVNGGTLRIKGKQEMPSVVYFAPSGGASPITIAACLETKDADEKTNSLPQTGKICQDITLESSDTEVGMFTLGGFISGLTGTVVLQSNGGDNESINADGFFTFDSLLPDGGSYAVTILTQPSNQTCVVTNDTGTVSGNVTNVTVTCTTNTHTISGTVSGLTGIVVLENNGGDDESINSNGAFTFNTSVNYGSTYAVSVGSQPSGQTCIVTNDTGTISGNVTNVNVTCTTNTHTISGTVSGLTGTVVLQNNGGDNETLIANGTFTFSSSISYGATYNVTVLTQPSGQTCIVNNDTGTITGDITNVTVTCTTNTHTVSGTVSGLVGTFFLENNGGDFEIILSDGIFTFNTALNYGTSYAVAVLVQPTGQTCIVANDTGTITGDISNVTVTCTTNTHTISGTVSGLTGTVVLQNNGGDDETINANGAFVFDTAINYGNIYSVTVLTQPSGKTCVASNETGTVTGDVTNVTVTCSTNTHTIGGTTSGLTGTLVLQNNGGSDKILIANGAYQFSTAFNYNSAYTITVLSQPTGQTCVVANDTGTLTSDVSNVNITCTTSTHTIAGTVSGLTGTVVLQNNGGDNESINANGAFVFNTAVNYGVAYIITVLTQPSGQTCTITNSSGTITGNVTNITVTCANTYSLSGTFTGIPNGSSVTLIDNESGQTLLINGVISSTGSFLFATEYDLTDSFDVSVQTQTSTLACTLVSEDGTFTGSDISNLELNCATKLCNSVESKYLKHCSPTAADAFGGGNMVAISKNFAVVSTNLDDANSDTTPSNNALADSGAVFVYQRDDLSGTWYAVDFLKASNLEASDWFGYAVALDGESKRIIVGARQEDSNSAAAPANNSLSAAGAAYIFERDTTGNWTQVAYLKHPSPTATDNCGSSVAIDGNYAVMGCPDEDSNSDLAPANNASSASGCAIVYKRSGGGTWSQEDFIKASNLEAADQFGSDVAISGTYLIIGSPAEDSNTDVLPGNNLASASGAAYIYRYDGVSNWAQEDYIKASNKEANDNFGASVDVTEEGYAIVGARNEDSNSQATPANNAASASGAAYIYERDGLGNWAQTNYLKHTAPTASDLYGIEVAISGNYAAVGVQSEDSDGPYAVNELSSASGAVFTYQRSVGVWSQNQYLKAFNLDVSDLFGTSVAIDEDQLLIGSTGEDSSGTSPFNESTSASGSGYIYELSGTTWIGD